MEKPPFQITTKILSQVAHIHEIVGELKSFAVVKPSMKLRKENKIRTVHHSLAIEGNSLTEEQITAILENKRVVGPKAQILEVQNALAVYESLSKYKPTRETDLLRAHGALMKGLVKGAGKYRTTQVGIFKGTKVSHMAPPAKQVPRLMESLFEFLNKDGETPWVIKACVFHYELEFIHPFEDGNGRMGRLWQQLLLMRQAPLFEYLSTETLIHKNQKAYYQILEKCDRAGKSTYFIEFSLDHVLKALLEFKAAYRPLKPKGPDRIRHAIEHFGDATFSRKDYLGLHQGLSTATASRDLALAVKDNILKVSGDRALAVYQRAKRRS